MRRTPRDDDPREVVAVQGAAGAAILNAEALVVDELLSGGGK